MASTGFSECTVVGPDVAFNLQDESHHKTDFVCLLDLNVRRIPRERDVATLGC